MIRPSSTDYWYFAVLALFRFPIVGAGDTVEVEVYAAKDLARVSLSSSSFLDNAESLYERMATEAPITVLYTIKDLARLR